MASIYDEAQQLTPAELAKIINGDHFAASGIQTTGTNLNSIYGGMYPPDWSQANNAVPTFNKPGGKIGKLPKFDNSIGPEVSAYASTGATGSGELAALQAIAGMDQGGMPPMPRRDPRTGVTLAPGTFAPGDAWSGMRVDNNVTSIPGMVTGNAPGILAAHVAAPKPKLNVTDNINRFLSEQGVNTAGLTLGQQGNALRDAMGFSGSHNGEFH